MCFCTSFRDFYCLPSLLSPFLLPLPPLSFSSPSPSSSCSLPISLLTASGSTAQPDVLPSSFSGCVYHVSYAGQHPQPVEDLHTSSPDYIAWGYIHVHVLCTCMTLLASLFLPSPSLVNKYMYVSRAGLFNCPNNHKCCCCSMSL